ncbi:hypothetical protein [Actinosynnema mirum]|uniref:Uncharacterized protein n=1 Tax=Actinosynnema mirum (strain ATCC 29888 / DSM 43827 / JCM 3225 / NBRC 14064 / NCIMB 13271 / NRRL B-12336 / IMRU 3971 / 101) TaxID=446462 RepID=C6WQT8_ACTMD|nr:hypothetical protein [Actinosynnema mirum]ACU38778.1 conserved hypothetical protein [Actinosynnema mirum DSM 43827]
MERERVVVRERRSGARPPTTSDVAVIAGMADPVLRNVLITHCYHRLSTALAALTGGSPNWCAFAVWASKQVGQTIRQEDPRRALERLLSTPRTRTAVGAVAVALRVAFPRRSLDDAERLVREVVVAAARLDAASEAAARGNLKVFAEIGHEFARFLAKFGAPSDLPDEQRIAAFRAALRPGEPPEGQYYLRQAFTHYLRAMRATDPKARAESLLLANVEVGLHEQTRLQPEITAALDAPSGGAAELERRLLEALLPGNRLVRLLRVALAALLGRRGPLRAATARLADAARAATRRVVTAQLMHMALPDGTALSLGEDLRGGFPAELAHPADPELLALLRVVDPTEDSLVGTGARDWADLADRMHCIADLFRCQAQRSDLLSPPFTDAQVAAAQSGVLPDGRL